MSYPKAPFFHPSVLPVGRALADIRPSPSWRLFQGWRPSKKNRRAARIGNGTRMALALLKRLDAKQDKQKTLPSSRTTFLIAQPQNGMDMPASS